MKERSASYWFPTSSFSTRTTTPDVNPYSLLTDDYGTQDCQSKIYWFKPLRSGRWASGLVFSIGRATVVCSEGRGFEPHRGQRFFSFSIWAHFLSRANAYKALFGIFSTTFYLITFISLYTVQTLFFRSVENLETLFSTFFTVCCSRELATHSSLSFWLVEQSSLVLDCCMSVKIFQCVANERSGLLWELYMLWNYLRVLESLYRSLRTYF